MKAAPLCINIALHCLVLIVAFSHKELPPAVEVIPEITFTLIEEEVSAPPPEEAVHHTPHPKKMAAVKKTPAPRTRPPAPKKKAKVAVQPYITPPQPAMPPEEKMRLVQGFFSNILRFPEQGKVILKISVQKNGMIGTVEIVSFESKQNVDYLLACLPLMQIDGWQAEKEETVVITFVGESEKI
ncbi:MAG: hypothetical protein A3F09_02145 [Chlamydiae bacterium RIFCSPHIGHO2_12_FULL_49_11]|nr:MAG: hypothetical protein A3F09_02145 [Chlamydiae bacterium RIFCSPHIGHO2_12_FULL_49_11]